MKRLTVLEEEVMDVLWGTDQALSSQEISTLKEGLDANTSQTLLRRLRNKKFVEVVRIELRKKSLTRIYRPNISESDYLKSYISERGMKSLVSGFVPDHLDDLDGYTEDIVNTIKHKAEELRNN
ncbi:BlaI/MecI/CopY family transcriptional regulator [Xylocopilactobacillus apicola]|uniref:Penicillinase repressor n=1 Tax=Xylocopilactobacillus apicola TaxID=2932184 RepID=A0AAU9CZK0_9LACO|nr:BlaI/MecI/CopY family transcriptional regulator [Xylocopilactobacillus apicola]BDR59452.1 hypothetical protein XA3_18930 [Xylocopilactobacillus apicola]